MLSSQDNDFNSLISKSSFNRNRYSKCRYGRQCAASIKIEDREPSAPTLDDVDGGVLLHSRSGQASRGIGANVLNGRN